ncbi:hypothetical protein MMA231_00911 [Asticcacaulis sp. MM231]|uniref:M20/M25/M40 family metallo-hydrolase n=1 Tax=Asticcacaulis sp. MM231 TaxID=3157666 RepID=UPI0032D59CD7
MITGKSITLMCLLGVIALPIHAADSYEAAAKRLFASPGIAAAKAHLTSDYPRIVDDIVTLTEIPAPPFKEQARAEAFMALLKSHGLSDVRMDAEGNVMGLRKGTGGGPLVAVGAHLDTVFPEGTDVKVRRTSTRLSAPGIGDDTSSLGVMLGLIRALDAAAITTKGDILFVGDVGEEGLGDLRGVRYLFTKGDYAGKIDAFIALEPGGLRPLMTGALGSKRYRATFSGPGGHSMLDFGIVNPAYAMGDAITRFAATKAPPGHGTVFNVGIVEGGTSVNSIPSQVSMSVDMRSEDVTSLKDLETGFLAKVKDAVTAENARRSTAKGAITLKLDVIGDRPVAKIDPQAPIIRTAAAAIAVNGGKVAYEASSTDANLPMSLGIPTTTLGSGFSVKGMHSPEEDLDLQPEADIKAMVTTLGTILLLADSKK